MPTRSLLQPQHAYSLLFSFFFFFCGTGTRGVSPTPPALHPLHTNPHNRRATLAPSPPWAPPMCPSSMTLRPLSHAPSEFGTPLCWACCGIALPCAGLEPVLPVLQPTPKAFYGWEYGALASAAGAATEPPSELTCQAKHARRRRQHARMCTHARMRTHTTRMPYPPSRFPSLPLALRRWPAAAPAQQPTVNKPEGMLQPDQQQQQGSQPSQPHAPAASRAQAPKLLLIDDVPHVGVVWGEDLLG